MNDRYFMTKIAIYSIVVIVFSIAVFSNQAHADAVYNSTYYPTKNTTNLSKIIGAPTYMQIKINLHNYNLAQAMNRNSDKILQENELKEQKFSQDYWKTNGFPSVNETKQLQ